MNSTQKEVSNSVVTEYDFESIYPNRKALSSSQVLGYEKSPQDFYLKYELGIRDDGSIPMKVGSIFSELHANRSFDFRTALRECSAPKHIADRFERVMPRFPVVPAEVPLLVPYKGWIIRITLDGFIKDALVIIENKTGQKVWDKERVMFDDQLSIQAWGVWKLYGVIPKEIILNWVSTKPSVSQELQTFKTFRSVKAIKIFEKRLDLILENIEAKNWTQPLYA